MYFKIIVITHILHLYSKKILKKYFSKLKVDRLVFNVDSISEVSKVGIELVYALLM